MLGYKLLTIALDFPNFFPLLPVVHDECGQALLALDHANLVVQLVYGVVHTELYLVYVVFPVQAQFFVIGHYDIVHIVFVLHEKALYMRVDVLLMLYKLVVDFLHKFLLELAHFPLQITDSIRGGAQNPKTHEYWQCSFPWHRRVPHAGSCTGAWRALCNVTMYGPRCRMGITASDSFLG